MKTNSNQNVVFLTYDGLLDPLGGSQILPYLIGISNHTNAVHVLSFEKALLSHPHIKTIHLLIF